MKIKAGDKFKINYGGEKLEGSVQAIQGLLRKRYYITVYTSGGFRMFSIQSDKSWFRRNRVEWI